MSALRSRMADSCPQFAAGSLYLGYMDMTYFAFTPLELKNKGLKIAAVYLHGQNRLEAWLAGVNRKVQAEYIEKLKGIDIEDYRLSKVSPGTDSIIEYTISEQPDFDRADKLMQAVSDKTAAFAGNILVLVNG